MLPQVASADSSDAKWTAEKSAWLQTVKRISQIGARFTYVGKGWLCSGSNDAQDTVLGDIMMNDTAGAVKVNVESGGILIRPNTRLTTVGVINNHDGQPLSLRVSPQTGPDAGTHCWITITPPLAEPGEIRVANIVDP
jgi:hypothetical protein